MALNDTLIDLFKQMLLIRRFEEKVREMYIKDSIKGMLHLCIGQEAVAVGAISALGKDDYIVSTHRGHGHFIAKGADIRLMMAELFGKKTGYCKGKGGSMHIADIDQNHLGANGIVGGGIPIATGAALAIKNIKQTDQVVICFFGDGALNIGVFHESLNLAGLWKLPVVYICENNLYAISTHTNRACAVEDPAKRAESYAMPGVTVDGMDVLAVRNQVAAAVKRARNGEGPSMLVCQTYRFFGHGRNPDCSLYRTKEEEQAWKTKCPLEVFRDRLLKEKMISENDVKNMEAGIAREIDAAVEFAEQSPYPLPEDLEADIYA